MKDRFVYFVVGDIGGAKEILPVARVMARNGWLVRFVADPEGKGKDHLNKDVLPGVMMDGFPRDPHEAWGIAIGTSATAYRAQLAWTRFGKANGIPVVWVEDMYGTASRPEVMEAEPDLLFVGDHIAYEAAINVRPYVGMMIRGKPSMALALEKIGRKAQIRRQVRKALELHCIDSSDRALLVTYWSGGEDPRRVHEHLRAVTQLTGACGRKMRIAVRLHPKLREEDSKALVGVAKSGQNWLAPFESVKAADADELVIASDLNIFDWGGTGAVVSVLAGVPAIVALFPDDAERRKRFFPPNGTPPLVAFGALQVASEPGALIEAVASGTGLSLPFGARDLPLQLRPLTRSDADERIAAEISHLLRNPPRR